MHIWKREGHQDTSKQENQLNKTKAKKEGKRDKKAVRHTESNKITKLKLSVFTSNIMV